VPEDQHTSILMWHAGILKQTDASGSAYVFQLDMSNLECDLGVKIVQHGMPKFGQSGFELFIIACRGCPCNAASF